MNDLVMNKFGILRHLNITGTNGAPLHGTSFVAKDMFDVAGYVTGAGNPDWLRTHAPAKTTAPAVQRMLEGGSSLLGKSCTDELAYAMDGVNVHYGTPLNPQFADRIPGGSSCGSVSAVAGGVVDFALGTDTAGSVRVPAAYCGVFGFRPTHARVSLEGVVPLAPSFDTVGWFARTGSGLQRCGEILLNAGNAKNTGAKTSAGARGGGVPEPLSPNSPAKILVAYDAFASTGETLKAAFASYLQILGRHYSIVDIELSSFGWQDFRETFRLIQGWECWQAHGEWITTTKPVFGPAVAKRFEIASQVTADQHQRASENRLRIAKEIDTLLADGSLLCIPTAPDLPPLLTATAAQFDANRIATMNISVLAPLAKIPAVSVPVALGHNSFAGISFLSRQMDDENLLGWCAQYCG